MQLSLQPAGQCRGGRSRNTIGQAAGNSLLLQIRQGYLAIRCENTFSGVVALDEENNLLTTKTASADHGYGLIQMRRIAAKYGSTLSVSYNAERFTVMTALKLP